MKNFILLRKLLYFFDDNFESLDLVILVSESFLQFNNFNKPHQIVRLLAVDFINSIMRVEWSYV